MSKSHSSFHITHLYNMMYLFFLNFDYLKKSSCDNNKR